MPASPPPPELLLEPLLDPLLPPELLPELELLPLLEPDPPLDELPPLLDPEPPPPPLLELHPSGITIQNTVQTPISRLALMFDPTSWKPKRGVTAIRQTFVPFEA